MFKREFEIFLQDDKKLRELFEGRKPFVQFETDEFRIKPFELIKPKDFELPENYPNCCEYHKGIPSYIENWFNRFPECCKRHKEYKKSKWFKRKDFENVPEKIKTQLLYTEHHIVEHIDDVDWYKKITDYLEYNIQSFGSPEVGADRYYTIIEHYIRYADTEKSKINKRKRKLLLEYFNREKEDGKEHKTDLNILQSIFNKWVKTIPDIGPFINVKEKVADKFPLNLILFNGEYNPYLGETKFRTRTRSELISILVQITKNSLLAISNSSKSSSEAKIPHFRILEENHRLKQNRLLQQYSKGERKYIKIIKQWLKNEKQFFTDAKTIDGLKSPKETSIGIEIKEQYKDISQKVVENDIQGALKELKIICEANSDFESLLKQVIHQLGRYNEMNGKFNQGIVATEDYLLEINRVRMATIELLDGIKK